MTNIQLEDDSIILSHSNRKLISEIRISFEYPIEHHICLSDFVVIRLRPTDVNKPGMYQNIVAINNDGSVRWWIEKAPEEEYYDYYGDVYETDGELRAYNLAGTDYKVDKKTGEVSDEKFVK